MEPASTLPDVLRAGAEARPDRELLRYEGASATYREVEEDSNRVARALAARGAREGDRIALMMPNGLEWPIAALAVAKLGAITVPVNISFGARDLAHVLRDSGARLAIGGATQLAPLSAASGDCPDLESVVGYGPPARGGGSGLDLTQAAMAEPAQAPPSPRRVTGDEPVTIQYTSGTTGFPKGCVLSHRYWRFLAARACEYASLAGDDVVLTAQPFYYMDPTWNFVACMLSGAPLVILPRFSASRFWRSVTENGVTFFYCLGTMPVYMYKQPPRPEWERGHRVRLVLCSGIPPRLHAAFEARWGCPWREAYGTTEVGAPLMVPADDATSVGSGAMGKPIADYEARVARPGGEPIPDGETGELQLRGGAMMTGYWNQPDATRAWKPDGWARTGDLVFRDARGYYHIVGRLKDMIRRGGENIAAAEVEAALCEHPEVLAAACVAVPDEERGEEVKAFVQLRPAPAAAMLLPPAELLAFATKRLAPFKVPRYVEYVDELPLTPSEKIAKHALLAEKPDQRVGAYDARVGRWVHAPPVVPDPPPP